MPKIIVSDCGTEFENGLIQEIIAIHKINIHYTKLNRNGLMQEFMLPIKSIYTIQNRTENPQSYSMIKRFHWTILEHIQILQRNLNIKTSYRMQFSVITTL